ncbi:uroporphyrinogen-III synthase [Thraustotheca clavata]|uniref:Uroporphyrinogen-III synthase n=1 Tax=Thraustotheca clavata TaxID=74557 RepID=A0A1W0A652_9STRA|nr:uroporphyrinogen-III synthase [Thraustotheca clavata]
MTTLFLKAHDAKYQVPFEAAGYSVAFSDVLTFTRLNENVLVQSLSKIANYASVIVTSPRASQAVVDAITSLPSQALISLSTVPIYSVGKTTSKPLIDIGLNCLGDDAGSGEALAQVITTAEGDWSKPTLFICGEKHHDALPNSFASLGRVLEELVVYSSVQVERIAYFQNVENALPSWVVFFSPSGVQVAKKMEYIKWSNIKKAAIGKTTAAALAAVAQDCQDASWNANTVAAKPTVDALLEGIAGYDKKEC